MKQFNSLEWLQEQITNEFEAKKEAKRKARNKRKAEKRKRRKNG